MVCVVVAELLRPAAVRTPETFVATLLQGIRAHDVRQVTSLFQYPFRLNAPGVPYPIPVQSPAELARMYNMIFNPLMRCAIESSRLPTREASHPAYKLAIAEGVVTIADGRVIAVRTENSMKITRMTLLLGSRPPAKPPQRLGSSSHVRVSGRLGFDDIDAYVITVPTGSEMTAAIEGFPGRSLLLRVRDAATRSLVKGASTEFARAWTARIARSGDYRVEVVRNTGYCDPDLSYVLTLGVH